MSSNYRRNTRSNNGSSSVPPELLVLILLVSMLVISFISSIAVYSISKIKNQSTPDSDSSVSAVEADNNSVDNNSVALSAPQLKTLDGYKIITMQESDLSNGELVLINNEHPFDRDVEDTLKPVKSSDLSAFGLSSIEMRANEKIINPIYSMLTDFYNKTALDAIYVSSCYRSNDDQQNLYDREVENVGEDEAQFWVAKPGCSEHHSGYAVDLALMESDGSTTEYDGKGQYKQLNLSAPKYGFIVRYPEEKKDVTNIYHEPWHFRYIGLPHSRICSELGMCFEEYIEYLRGFSPDGEHLSYTMDGKKYDIYFCKGANVYVPENSAYTISGNNYDGFVVTVEQ